MAVHTRRDGGTGYVTLDNPPVNAISHAMRRGLSDAVKWAEAVGLTRVILTGARRVFAAGADVRELDSVPVAPHLPDILNAIEASTVPWIAAISGVTLGGGAEIAMACRMRIMAPGAQISLPEVTLGVIPNAGGTQRLPRLVGLKKALDMVSLGRSLGAEEALASGLVHAIDADPVQAAFSASAEELACIMPVRDLPVPEIDAEVLQAARATVADHMPGQIAPRKAIDVIEAGLSQSFDDALKLERETFVALRGQEQARALRHIFFAERALYDLAHASELSEIAPGDANDFGAVAAGPALFERLRKMPVLTGVDSEFIGDRILARFREAADTVFMDGSTPWEVDEAMVEFGFSMGPYEAEDLSGLDMTHAHRRQGTARDPNRRHIPIAGRMAELGKLGKITGAGWYRYPGGNGKVDDPIVADLALEEAYLAGRTRTDYSADEIRNRLLLAMINEAADMLHEGVAHSARDIDAVTVLALGFPRWRGGLMHYADTLGAAEIVARLEVLCGEDPVVWRVSPLLYFCAETNTSLTEAPRASQSDLRCVAR